MAVNISWCVCVCLQRGAKQRDKLNAVPCRLLLCKARLAFTVKELNSLMGNSPVLAVFKGKHSCHLLRQSKENAQFPELNSLGQTVLKDDRWERKSKSS